ncbi:DDT domain-containing protein PTM-like [Salvia miltiorrhiza]|uniref:DDT domain-containing protein PTM-like n=1 Tax=Salvia miltiorrhiza TaxID=226208 RepID=UPI0025ACAF9C|nr:DDT domain-containing protein PTM-like [Salvia miltiorrhiza]
MEYVGRKVKKEFLGRAACFGAVEAYSPATGLFKVVYEGGDSEEMELAEVSSLLLAPPSSLGVKAGEGGSIGQRGAFEGNPEISSGVPRDSGRNSAEFDLNICGEIDLNEDGGDRREGGGLGGLHGLDLNEGVNYILHDEFDCNQEETDPVPTVRMFDLNLELDEEAEEISSTKSVRSFDLNVELKEDQSEGQHSQPAMEIDDKGKAAIDDEDDCTIVAHNPPRVVTALPPPPPPPYYGGGGGGGSGWWNNRTALDMELMRRHILMASFPAQNYAFFSAAGVHRHLLPFPPQPLPPRADLPPSPPPPLPPKADLPPSSTSLDLGGASLLEFLSVYAFLRSFSVLLLISPFEIDEFAASLVSSDSTPLFDTIHLSLLTTLRRHLKSLSDEGSESASLCLRSLNWDFLDLITWPVFLIEYLLFHSPKYLPGVDLSEFEPLQSEYYTMPASAKVKILQHLCDDVVESEAYRAEVSRRGLMAERQSWNSRYFSCKGKKKVVGDVGSSSMAEECMNEFVDDGNGDECYLCKTDGNLICCDGCPAAFHAKCVGVSSSLLPEGQWCCPECVIDADKPYKLTRSIRGVELLGTDPHARHYYTCCHYLLVVDSCDDEYSILLYKGNDIAGVIAELEASSNLYYKIVSAIRKHWNLTRQFACPEQRLRPSETNQDAERKGEGGTEAKDTIMEGCSDDPIERSGQGRDQTSANYDGGASSSSSSRTNYVNWYEFARMASSCSKEMASKGCAEEAGGELSIAKQMRVISNKYAAFCWSNMRNLSLNDARKEKCGWCLTCKVAEYQRDCLFIISDSVRATQDFTTEALGIQPIDNRKNHLVDVICHVMWIEDRLLGLLSGPWSNPRYSQTWRRYAMEAPHIGYVKILLLQVESNLPRVALSGEWTKSVDSSATMGSAYHMVRKCSKLRAPPKCEGKRKCAKQDISQTPKDAQGVSLSWWRGGRFSRHLFNWKALPRSLASKAARQAGRNKIQGISYPDSGDYAKRTKCIAWKAAVHALKTVEQLALQVRQLDANIKWNAIGNINLLPEKEGKKPVKSFKHAVICKKRRHEAKYLIDFGRTKLIPDVVVRHGSLVEDPSSRRKRKRYWVGESHVPLHLLKAYGEKRLARASNNDEAPGLQEETMEPPERKKGFDYLFERAELS